MKITKKAKAENLVIKANSLVLGRHNLSLMEQKFVLAIISMIEEGDTEIYSYRIKATDFAKLIGVSSSNIYRSFKEIAENLIKQPISITTADGGWKVMAWISSCEYIPKTGTVEIELSPKLKPYLIELKGNFTRYYLANVVKLRKKYAIRLYELIKSNEFKKSFNIDIEYIKDAFQCSNYTAWSQLERKVIKPAVEEINQKTDLFVYYHFGKSDNKINFKVENSTKRNLELLSEKYNPDDLAKA